MQLFSQTVVLPLARPMERAVSIPTSNEACRVNTCRYPESFDSPVVREAKFASSGLRTFSSQRAAEATNESRDDPTSQRRGADRQPSSYERIYYHSRYNAHPRYIPRHHQIQRNWHHPPPSRWSRRVEYHPSLYPPGGMVPISTREIHVASHYKSTPYGSAKRASTYTTAPSSSPSHFHIRNSATHSSHVSNDRQHSSVVIIPPNIVIPREIAPSPTTVDVSPNDLSLNGKRSSDSSDSSSTRQIKRSKLPEQPTPSSESAFDKLNLLCAATIDLGPLQDNPTGCSCPKSKCIALYCDCFKAGRRCDPVTCTCLNCKNTLEESGPSGARSKAIQSILARNPRAFNAGAVPLPKLPPGEACNCIRSRCLKLYCTCFQVGKACNPAACSCVGCLNTSDDKGGHRAYAIEVTLEKRPDAFEKPKPKEIGSGCACKNNRCIRKYCECFRTKLPCTQKCSCRDCANLRGPEDARHSSSTIQNVDV